MKKSRTKAKARRQKKKAESLRKKVARLQAQIRKLKSAQRKKTQIKKRGTSRAKSRPKKKVRPRTTNRPKKRVRKKRAPKPKRRIIRRSKARVIKAKPDSLLDLAENVAEKIRKAFEKMSRELEDKSPYYRVHVNSGATVTADFEIHEFEDARNGTFDIEEALYPQAIPEHDMWISVRARFNAPRDAKARYIEYRGQEDAGAHEQHYRHRAENFLTMRERILPNLQGDDFEYDVEVIYIRLMWVPGSFKPAKPARAR